VQRHGASLIPAFVQGRAGRFARRRESGGALPLLRVTERAQLGIVWPDYVAANTGTLDLSARGGNGRSVSLVTDILFGVLLADQLVTSNDKAFERSREHYPDALSLPSSLNLVTGPSRSADIENDLTIGVHGPGKWYAVIIE
jgi:L-lactate utilization protein LutC